MYRYSESNLGAILHGPDLAVTPSGFTADFPANSITLIIIPPSNTALVTIAGNAGAAGATLSYTDGTARSATAAADGSYSFTVSYNWSGTVPPSKACYTFNPLSKNYASPVVADLNGEDYTYTLDPGSGCADVAVTVNAAAQGTYGIQSGSQAHPIYPGVFDGAVSVVSTNAADILVSERQIYGNSFSELMGILGEPADDGATGSRGTTG